MFCFFIEIITFVAELNKYREITTNMPRKVVKRDKNMAIMF